MNAHRLPTTIPEYLEHLRRSLAGADPALIQDALYDAEEYLRSELAENPGRSEAEVIAAVASSYGAPDEVADIYRDTEVRVQTALRAPPPKPRDSLVGRFFVVAALALFWFPFLAPLLAVAGLLMTRRHRGWRRAAAVAVVLSFLVLAAVVALFLFIPNQRKPN